MCFESHQCDSQVGVHEVEVMCWSSSDLAAMDCEEEEEERRGLWELSAGAAATELLLCF